MTLADIKRTLQTGKTVTIRYRNDSFAGNQWSVDGVPIRFQTGNAALKQFAHDNDSHVTDDGWVICELHPIPADKPKPRRPIDALRAGETVIIVGKLNRGGRGHYWWADENGTRICDISASQLGYLQDTCGKGNYTYTYKREAWTKPIIVYTFHLGGAS